MADDDPDLPFAGRRRLGGWLPRKEAELVAFRKGLAKNARAHADRIPRVAVVEEFAALVHGDAVLRMNLTRAIEEALEVGYEIEGVQESC